MSKRLQISLDTQSERLIDAIAEARGIPRARVVRELILSFGPSLRRYQQYLARVNAGSGADLRDFDFSAFLAGSIDGDSYDWLSG